MYAYIILKTVKLLQRQFQYTNTFKFYMHYNIVFTKKYVKKLYIQDRIMCVLHMKF